jgi:hypothetical protein
MGGEPERMCLEAILDPGVEIRGCGGAFLGGFWQCAYSDVLVNTIRAVSGEYLVALALDVAQSPRIDWDAVDLCVDELLLRAGVLAEEHGLRGYDSIHLASAELVNDRELVLAAGDRYLLEAGEALGLRVSKLIKGQA